MEARNLLIAHTSFDPSTIPKQSTSTIPKQSTSTIPKQSTSTIPKQSTSTIPKQSTSTIPKQSISTIPKQTTSTIHLKLKRTISKVSTSTKKTSDKRMKYKVIPNETRQRIITMFCSGEKSQKEIFSTFNLSKSTI